MDEGFVTSAMRALAELKQLHLLDAALSQEIGEAVLDDNFRPQKKHCSPFRRYLVKGIYGESVVVDINVLVDLLVLAACY